MSNNPKLNRIIALQHKLQGRRFTNLLVVMAIFGLIGIIYMTASHAATPTANVQAEAGTLSSAATLLSDSSASNGGAVKFGTGSGRPSGPGITPYESLANQGTFSATANSVSPAAQLSFLPGTYQFSNFNDASGVYGVLLWHNILGMRGSVKTSTIFQMVPNSSTRASSVPPQSTFATGGTNPLYYMRIDQSPVLSGFTILGTTQGHLYNGLNLYQTTNASLSDMLIKGIPGDNGANPGETFYVNVYRATGTTFNNVELDGKDSNGTKVGASGIGINFGSGTTITDLYSHDLQYGAGLAAYTTQDITITRPVVVGGFRSLNFERVSGTVTITQPNLTGASDIAIAIASDTGSATYNIYDPVLQAGQKLDVRVTGYSGNARTQDPNAVHLYIGGVLRNDMMNLTVTN